MKSLFQLILTEANGNFAVPEIEINSEFETTFSIQDATDISNRKDNVSKNITFPGSKNNNRIFNNLFSFNRSSDSTLTETLFYNYSPNVGVKAVLYENNEVVFTGTLKINDINKDDNGVFTYQGVITGKIVSFFADIKGKLLGELSGFNIDSVLTIDNIVNSWEYSDEAKYLFPMIDYGRGSVPRRDKFDIRNLRPAIYLRYYIISILSSQGYALKSDFINSDIFNRIFVPFSDADFGATIFGDVKTWTGGSYTTEIDTQSFPSRPVNFGFASLRYGDFTENKYIGIQRNVGINLHTDTDSNLKDFSSTGDVFTIQKFGSTGAKITVNFTSVKESSGNAILRVGLYPVRNDGTIFFESAIDYIDHDHNTNPLNITQTLTLPYQEYEKGYTFGVFAICVAGSKITFTQNTVEGILGDTDPARGSFFSYDLLDSYNLLQAVPKDQIATDFLRSVFNTFNLYVIQNPDNERELIIEPYDVFYDQAKTPQAYALNWTKKLDNRKLKIKINTALPKAYNFKFKDDGDYYNILYKNTYNDTYGNFTVQNKNGSAEAKPIEITFSPTVVVRENGDDKTMPAIFTGEVGDKKTFKSNLRLLFNNGVKACTRYDISNRVNGNYNVLSSGLTTYQASHTILNLTGTDLFSLLFGVPKAVYYPVIDDVFDLPTLFTEMYSAQLSEINDDNIFSIDVFFNLKEIDISNLNLRKPIFISTPQGDAYFKILSITYYNSDEVSQVLLQKIII